MEKYFFTLLILLSFCSVSAQENTQQLDEVEVQASRGQQFSTPTQTLNAEDFQRTSAIQLSDAVKYFAGAMVKDYGGIGGIKTVSVRSLGSTHTAVAIDGIPVNDCQTGQIDLGRFSLENVSKISLTNAQSDNIFVPAKLIASASLLSVYSQKPVFPENKKYHLKTAAKFGSFGFFNPALLFNVKANDKTALSFDTEWLSAKGDYPYIFETMHARRSNNDVQKLRSDISLYSNLAENQQLQAKLYYYRSVQGLPGAVIDYNPNSSFERMSDKNLFVQASYRTYHDSHWNFQANGKYNYAFLHYKDEYAKTTNYHQDEYYLSSAMFFHAFPFSLSLANDFLLNTMNSNMSNFAEPERFTWLSALSTKYDNRHFLLTGSLLATLTAPKNHQRLSPFLSISYKPFSTQDFRLRVFYKNIFRLPSFNDLYYPNIGNTGLRPENTNQYNVGATYAVETQCIASLQITADAYYNTVSDKIIATPKHSLLIWSMENIGKVEIKGLDLGVETAYRYYKDKKILLRGSYTYQEAIDVTIIDNETDPPNKHYGHQIPYVPRFSGTGNGTIETAWVDISCSVVWSGKRYSQRQNSSEIPHNLLAGYADIGFSLRRKFHLKKNIFSLTAEMLNILDKNYEIVSSYPMPGRNFRVGVSLEM